MCSWTKEAIFDRSTIGGRVELEVLDPDPVRRIQR